MGVDFCACDACGSVRHYDNIIHCVACGNAYCRDTCDHVVGKDEDGEPRCEECLPTCALCTDTIWNMQEEGTCQCTGCGAWFHQSAFCFGEDGFDPKTQSVIADNEAEWCLACAECEDEELVFPECTEGGCGRPACVMKKDEPPKCWNHYHGPDEVADKIEEVI